jgi:hypothetical protein
MFVSWDSVSESWVGHPIEQFAKLNGPAGSIVILPGGDAEHTYDLPRVGIGCIQHWRVNSAGVIVGYRTEGRCRPIG